MRLGAAPRVSSLRGMTNTHSSWPSPSLPQAKGWAGRAGGLRGRDRKLITPAASSLENGKVFLFAAHYLNQGAVARSCCLHRVWGPLLLGRGMSRPEEAGPQGRRGKPHVCPQCRPTEGEETAGRTSHGHWCPRAGPVMNIKPLSATCSKGCQGLSCGSVPGPPRSGPVTFSHASQAHFSSFTPTLWFRACPLWMPSSQLSLAPSFPAYSSPTGGGVPAFSNSFSGFPLREGLKASWDGLPLGPLGLPPPLQPQHFLLSLLLQALPRTGSPLPLFLHIMLMLQIFEAYSFTHFQLPM